MEYSERTYRGRFRSDRWAGFVVGVKDSDLWIGVDRGSFRPGMREFCLGFLGGLRAEMEAYIASDPGYASSLVPYDPRADAPDILVRMSRAARLAGVGPMAAVAGAVARQTGHALLREFAVREALVENGGDIWALTETGLDVALFAGASPLSDRVGLRVPAGEYGVCTSSGTVGPSLSLGCADAVMVVCGDVLLADAYATAFANRVQTADDVESVAALAGAARGVLGALVVKDDRMAAVGGCELKVFG